VKRRDIINSTLDIIDLMIENERWLKELKKLKSEKLDYFGINEEKVELYDSRFNDYQNWLDGEISLTCNE
jgi:hypothetical protein